MSRLKRTHRKKSACRGETKAKARHKRGKSEAKARHERGTSKAQARRGTSEARARHKRGDARRGTSQAKARHKRGTRREPGQDHSTLMTCRVCSLEKLLAEHGGRAHIVYQTLGSKRKPIRGRKHILTHFGRHKRILCLEATGRKSRRARADLSCNLRGLKKRPRLDVCATIEHLAIEKRVVDGRLALSVLRQVWHRRRNGRQVEGRHVRAVGRSLIRSAKQ